MVVTEPGERLMKMWAESRSPTSRSTGSLPPRKADLLQDAAPFGAKRQDHASMISAPRASGSLSAGNPSLLQARAVGQDWILRPKGVM